MSVIEFINTAVTYTLEFVVNVQVEIFIFLFK